VASEEKQGGFLSGGVCGEKGETLVAKYNVLDLI